MQLIFYWFRDMRLISIGGGADEVMLNIICKTMGILPKPSKK
jgi:citronellyl-CoA dehydrogenase